jgi:hypothetical protein
LLLESETVEPPEGAAELRVTVPVELFPPVTLVGFKVTDEIVGEELPGFTVKLVDTVAPPDCPKIGAVQLVVGLVLPTVKLTLVCPAGTVTGLGMGRVTGRVQGGFCESDISVPTRSRDVLNQKLESAGLYVSNCGWTLAASYGR